MNAFAMLKVLQRPSMGVPQVFVCLSLLCAARLCMCLDELCGVNDGRPESSSRISFLQHAQRRHAAGDHLPSLPDAKQRFPFDLVLWSHLPKTGGTTMRHALAQLCTNRGQKLQVCYPDLNCTGHSGLAFQYGPKPEMPGEDGIILWRQNLVEEKPNLGDQIVYGHGVQAGFEHAWVSGQALSHARVFVLREPTSWLISTWSHQNRHDWMPNYNMSLDTWIQQGKAEAFVDFYASFFIDIEVPNPWETPSAFQPSSGIPVLASRPDWRQLLADAVQNPNSLMMFQDSWNISLDRLGEFLQLTSSEHDHLSSAVSITENKAPQRAPVEVSLKKDNRDRLAKAIEPLQYLYNEVAQNYDVPIAGRPSLLDVQTRAQQNLPGDAVVTLSLMLD